MKLHLVVACGLAVLAPVYFAYAARVPIAVRPRSTEGHTMLRRDPPTHQAALFNLFDLEYFVQISIAGVNHVAFLTTNASDTYVVLDDPNVLIQDAGFDAINGRAKKADISFAGVTAKSQMFVNTSRAVWPASILGLGSTPSTEFPAAPNREMAIPIAFNIFKQQPTISPYITILLGRFIGLDQTPGDMTVGETLIGHEGITSQPHLPVKTGAGWQTTIDENGIIGPGGVIPYTSVVDGSQRAVVALEMLNTFTQVPQHVALALYGADAPLLDTSRGKVYEVPCSKVINLSFKFGGIEFPIHPLDIVLDSHGFLPLGSGRCIGGFQPILEPQPSSNTPDFDMLLGTTFLRNAYVLFYYGDNAGSSNPYIQMLPLTNRQRALTEFRAARGGPS